MTSTEWQEANPVCDPASVLSSDLFQGELFGDELVDIYNAAMADGSDDVLANEIPTLLPQVSECIESTKPDDIKSDFYSVPASVNGGMTMSPSLNDLTELLPAPTTSDGTIVESVKPATAVVTSMEQAESSESGTKRVHAVEAAEDLPPAKKQCVELTSLTTNVNTQTATTVNVVPDSPISQTAVVSSGVVDNSSNNNTVNDTPNPLHAQTATLHMAIAARPTSTVVASPAVVSPQPTPQVRGGITLPDSHPVVIAAKSVPVPDLSKPAGSMTTEADFKSVAQAAVSSLIMNVGTGNRSDSPVVTQENPTPVDTTTSHIKALTGSNWVAAISGGAGCTSSASSDADAKANSRAKRQNLTADERAKQNRDRNREHARNTRLRKKAYVEELKRTLMELVAQRDSAQHAKLTAAQRDVEQREVRFRVIEEFLKLRGRNEVDPSRWSAIVVDGFALTLPVTSFRNMVHGNEGVVLEQSFSGVSEVMEDSKLFASYLQSLGSGHTDSPVTLVYHCNRKNFLMDGNSAVLDWTASSVGAVNRGARVELSLRGTIKAKFCPASNKLISADINFDTGLIPSQFPTEDIKLNDENSGSGVTPCHVDAILDNVVPTSVVVVPTSSAASVTSSERGESSSDSSVDSSISSPQE